MRPNLRARRLAASFAVALVVSSLVAACSGSPAPEPVASSPDAAAPADATSAPFDAGPVVTFHEDVAPVLQARCQSCHREGGAGPFALETYAQAKARGPALAASTAARRMPPWGAGPSPDCVPQRPFKDDLRMTEGEIATLARWVAHGMPEGDPAKGPPKVTFAGDALADATHTLTIPRYRVMPATRDDMRCFVVDPQLTEDTWFDASSVVAGEPAVVHHALVFLDPNGASRAKGGASGHYACFGGPGISNTALLAAWAPGVPPTRYPPEVGFKVPNGALLVVQIHYHPAETPRDDATSFLLRRRTTPPAWAAAVRLIGNFPAAPALQPGPNDPSGSPTFLIPAGARGHTETMEFTMPASVPELPLATMGTHMHWVGTDMTVQIARNGTRPNQPASECLIATPHYDFNWQRGYAYDQPIAALPTIKGGDRIRMRCTYDNSTENPRVARALAEQRLSSPVDVRLGEETLDEMCLGAFTLLTPAL